MRPFTTASILAITAALAAFSPAQASSLRVTPVNLELTAPSATASLVLKNEEKQPLRVQIRVFRWSQVDGVEKYERTSDVVASPPATILQANSKMQVRIARVTDRPVSREESYRLVIDQLPDPSQKGNTSVSLAMRYLIPVFFSHPAHKPPALSWDVRRNGGKVEITARNSGDRRIRLSDLSIGSSAGQSAQLSAGLVGYVLSGSAKTWSFDARRAPSLSGGPVKIEVMSDVGQIRAASALR